MKDFVALGCGIIAAFGCIIILENIEKRRKTDEKEIVIKSCD